VPVETGNRNVQRTRQTSDVRSSLPTTVTAFNPPDVRLTASIRPSKGQKATSLRRQGIASCATPR